MKIVHKCPIWGDSFSQKCDLRRQMSENHTGKKYKCSKCKEIFTEKDKLNAHVKEIHKKITNALFVGLILETIPLQCEW